MNTEDKKILEILRKNQVVKAPDDFTHYVMNSITELEDSQKPVIQLNAVSAALLIFTAVLASLAVFYFFDNTIFENIFSPLTFLSNIFSSQYFWFNEYLFQIVGILKQNIFVVGLIVSLIALLSFDSLILKRKFNINMLTIV